MIDELLNAVDILNNVDNYIASLPDKQSECDSRLSDLYHVLENNSLNSSQCWHFVKEMKKVCESRRNVKNDTEIGKTFQNHCNKLNNPENRKMLLAELYKRKNRLDQEYNNRIYSNEQLIELGILKGGQNE